MIAAASWCIISGSFRAHWLPAWHGTILANIFANELGGTMQNAVARRHCEECVLGPETLTNRHAIGLVGMEQSRFQDRCLKPLGHPSPVTTSNTYALALVEQTSHRRQLATARARPRSRARASFGPALS